jgi:hypothetical protein
MKKKIEKINRSWWFEKLTSIPAKKKRRVKYIR